MRYTGWAVGLLGVLTSFVLGWVVASRANVAGDKQISAKGWEKGKGWVGPWPAGKNDEVGALNAMTPETRLNALRLIKKGEVYDLGVNYDAESFRWPGHNPGIIVTFRNPEGERRQNDLPGINDPKLNPDRVGWHSCALFINDNVGTQIDGLGHITFGKDNEWYNGFKEADWGGNFGVRKCDATTIPPIITRGVLIDVARSRALKHDDEPLPSRYRITVEDLKAALDRQKTKILPGDTVLIRTGTLKFWGENGNDHATLKRFDTAGIDLDAAKWLVEQQGAILIGSDTSGLEWTPDFSKEKDVTLFPVHKYLLAQQGVHIGEFHFLEQLSRDNIFEFCYICMTNKIRGTTAGFTLRPIAMR
jgi:kynurenine formamidase